jgi:tetratricopeptide (TPR) repeat protein
MFRRACLLVLLGGLLAPAPVLAAADCKAGKFADIPVTMIGRRPTMTAGINGRTDRFLVDSGAFHSTISAANAQQFGLAVRSLGPNARLTGVGGETSLSATTAKVFTIAGQDVHNVEFAVGGGETGFAGIIGQNVLGLEDVEYDLPHGAVRLLKIEGCKNVDLAYWAGERPYSVVKLLPTDHDKRSIGQVTVNGVTLKALFDTGAPSSTLLSSGARRLGLKPDDSDAAGFAHGVGRKEVRVWRSRLETIDIGGELIKGPTLSILDQSQDAFDMIIGMDFFLSHRLLVDNQHHRLYLTYEGGPAFGLALKGGAVDGSGQAIDLTDKSAEPTDAAGFSQRGAVAASRGQTEAAVADFDKAIALAPTEARYVVQRAMARLALRQPQLALADLDKALTLDPANIDARMTRAQMRVQNRSPNLAEDLDAADKALAPSSDTRLRLAHLNEQTDRLDAALANYDLWIKAHPDDAKRVEAFNGRCWTRALMNRDLNLALSDCDMALKLRPSSAEYLDSRALVRLRRGELDKALADYDAALAIQPRNAWMLYMRAVAERRAGKGQKADADHALALSINPRVAERAKRYGLEG